MNVVVVLAVASSGDILKLWVLMHPVLFGCSEWLGVRGHKSSYIQLRKCDVWSSTSSYCQDSLGVMKNSV